MTKANYLCVATEQNIINILPFKHAYFKDYVWEKVYILSTEKAEKLKWTERLKNWFINSLGLSEDLIATCKIRDDHSKEKLGYLNHAELKRHLINIGSSISPNTMLVYNIGGGTKAMMYLIDELIDEQKKNKSLQVTAIYPDTQTNTLCIFPPNNETQYLELKVRIELEEIEKLFGIQRIAITKNVCGIDTLDFSLFHSRNFRLQVSEDYNKRTKNNADFIKTNMNQLSTGGTDHNSDCNHLRENNGYSTFFELAVFHFCKKRIEHSTGKFFEIYYDYQYRIEINKEGITNTTDKSGQVDVLLLGYNGRLTALETKTLRVARQEVNARTLNIMKVGGDFVQMYVVLPFYPDDIDEKAINSPENTLGNLIQYGIPVLIYNNSCNTRYLQFLDKDKVKINDDSEKGHPLIPLLKLFKN